MRASTRRATARRFNSRSARDRLSAGSKINPPSQSHCEIFRGGGERREEEPDSRWSQDHWPLPSCPTTIIIVMAGHKIETNLGGGSDKRVVRKMKEWKIDKAKSGREGRKCDKHVGCRMVKSRQTNKKTEGIRRRRKYVADSLCSLFSNYFTCVSRSFGILICDTLITSITCFLSTSFRV